MNKIQKQATTIAAAFAAVAVLYGVGKIVYNNTQLRSDVDQCAAELNQQAFETGRLSSASAVCENDKGQKIADLEIVSTSYLVKQGKFCTDLTARFDREASPQMKFERATACLNVPEDAKDEGLHHLPVNGL